MSAKNQKSDRVGVALAAIKSANSQMIVQKKFSNGVVTSAFENSLSRDKLKVAFKTAIESLK
ncbi:hypothetical protein [Pseudoxanthomonas winnipegensis]|uniref:Uncharacterized protein n=1 Tax=Pseudoxanthomonas winnipegensis TaxID=2480810 RepID=A0A4Q8M2H1_9GAMM|nr:hypothetical protein [Pseudoxanthomonas winnipegensis]TAA41503.1 hypothetical protein EA655_11195 [Pseudoxanthomonas winnipegensis]